MWKLCYITLLILLSLQASAQAVRYRVAAPYLGLGAYSKSFADVFSPSANVAALARIKTASGGVYAENRFLLEELNFYSAVVALPSELGNFAFLTDYMGFKNFNESQLGVSYARDLGTLIDIGIKFNYYSFRIPSFPSLSTVNFELGLMAHLTEELHAGFHLYNPVGGRLSKTHNEKLGYAYSFGVGYEASSAFLLSAEIMKQEDRPPHVNAGVQYAFADSFFARAGLSTLNDIPYGGAGWGWKNMRLDVSASFHPQLGMSPGIMFIINFSGDDEIH